MNRFAAGKARIDFAEIINRVAYGKERVLLERRGKEVAAVIPIEDLHLLERLIEEEEDRIDIEDAESILSETKPEDWIPFEQIKTDLKAK